MQRFDTETTSIVKRVATAFGIALSLMAFGGLILFVVASFADQAGLVNSITAKATTLTAESLTNPNN